MWEPQQKKEKNKSSFIGCISLIPMKLITWIRM